MHYIMVMPRRKNGSVKLEKVDVLHEDKRHIEKIAKQRDVYEYEVVSEAVKKLDMGERF